MIVVGSSTEEAEPAGSPTSPAEDGMEGTNNAQRINWEAWEHFMYKALVLPYAKYTQTATFPPAQTEAHICSGSFLGGRYHLAVCG